MDGNGSRSLGSPVGNKGHLPELTVQPGPLVALLRSCFTAKLWAALTKHPPGRGVRYKFSVCQQTELSRRELWYYPGGEEHIDFWGVDIHF